MAVGLVNDIEQGLPLIRQSFKNLQSFFHGETKSFAAFNSGECMKLYSTVYTLCMDKKNGDANAAALYAEYRAEITNYLQGYVIPRLRRHRGLAALGELSALWSVYKRLISCRRRSTFDYLDRCYLPRKNLPSLLDTELMCFRDLVFNELKHSVRETVLALIERDRNGDAALDRALIKSAAVEIFVAMGLGSLRFYEEEFEAAILQATSEHYARKAASWIEVDSAPEYFAKADKAIIQDKKRMENLIHPESEPKVAEKVCTELLVVRATRLFENEDSGLRALIRDNKTDDVKTIFRLYGALTEQLKQVAELFQQHMAEEVTALVQAAEAASSVVKNLIAVHQRYSDIYVDSCFEKHDFFKESLEKAFKDQFGGKTIAGMTSAELMTFFCDELLKKGGEVGRMSEDEVTKTLEGTADLLTYVSSKDMFVEFYCRKLSRRLLLGRTDSFEHETSILEKMKLRVGADFTFRMERMIKDMKMVKENEETFQSYLSENPSLISGGTNISTTVLSPEFWPTYNPSNIPLPAEMAKAAEVYATFYGEKYPHKKLKWIHSLGTCHVNTKFGRKTIELVLSTHQAIVLYLFASQDTLSFSEIRAELNIDKGDSESDDELVRSLHSLSRGKYKILLKRPDCNKMSDDDVFEFNAEFSDPLKRIKVPLPSTAVERERKKVITTTEAARPYVVDCAIVRIMKDRKALAFQMLIKECIEVVSQKFIPDITMIKQRIDSLIERDFIERDDDDSTRLLYVA